MAGSYVSTLNLSAFSSGELSALLTAAKGEILTRLTGRVQNGSSSGQSFGVNLMSTDELNRLVNALTAALGMDVAPAAMRPNFNQSCHRGGYSATGVPL